VQAAFLNGSRQPRERRGWPPAGPGPLPTMTILTHKTKGAGGTVTRPGGWQPGRPAHNPRVESWPPLDRAGVTAGARSMPSTRT